jgi:uncharacterized membrane protein
MDFWRRYPTFIGFIVLMAATTAVAWPTLPHARALLLGFDAGAVLFLGLLIHRFRDSDPLSMRRRAADNEPDQGTMTLVSFVILGVVLTAVAVELIGSSGHDGFGVVLAVVTLALAWLFANCLFTLHYAHVYYLKAKHGGDNAGLQFPTPDDNADPKAQAAPEYWDFAYFAFVIGMTFQVSDVVITSKRLRRLALFHALLAFMFNIGVVALSVSLVASVLGG